MWHCADWSMFAVLSVMCSVFDSWFGFIFWGVAYFRMRRADQSKEEHRGGLVDVLSVALNIAIIGIGIFFLTVGTYASVQGIIDAFEAGLSKGVFSCGSNGI
jgi:heme/copper-type cytochrome/quinol oxidase subunit 2